jgi:hypothetical protein
MVLPISGPLTYRDKRQRSIDSTSILSRYCKPETDPVEYIGLQVDDHEEHYRPQTVQFNFINPGDSGLQQVPQSFNTALSKAFGSTKREMERREIDRRETGGGEQGEYREAEDENDHYRISCRSFERTSKLHLYQGDHTRGDEKVQNVKSLEDVGDRGPEDE